MTDFEDRDLNQLDDSPRLVIKPTKSLAKSPKSLQVISYYKYTKTFLIRKRIFINFRKISISYTIITIRIDPTL